MEDHLPYIIRYEIIGSEVHVLGVDMAAAFLQADAARLDPRERKGGQSQTRNLTCRIIKLRTA
jgi:hypothetical protein